MNKDAYYFPHFSNARHDRKIKRITKELGVEGYGIYFMLLEVLREQTDLRYPLADVDLLADEFRTSEGKITTIINNYNLFEIDSEQMFFSPKQAEYLQPYFAKSDRARNAAHKRWEQHKQLAETNEGDSNALQMQSHSNASKVKESKGKKTGGALARATDFYNQQIDNNQDKSLIKQYRMAADLILKQKALPKMDCQLTYQEFASCYNKSMSYGYKIHDYLMRMENWKDGSKDVSKKNKSISQTLQNWMSNDAKRGRKIYQ